MPLEEFVRIRAASMHSRINKKQERGPSEKEAIIHGIRVANEEWVKSWHDDPVDEEDLLALWDVQNGRCALTGQPMSTKINDPEVGSIDRKDSRRGYTADNVQWVLAWVNYMKSSMPERLFFKRCMQLGAQYTEWSLQKVRRCRHNELSSQLTNTPDSHQIEMMEEPVRVLKRSQDEIDEKSDEAEEAEGKAKEE